MTNPSCVTGYIRSRICFSFTDMKGEGVSATGEVTLEKPPLWLALCQSSWRVNECFEDKGIGIYKLKYYFILNFRSNIGSFQKNGNLTALTKWVIWVCLIGTLSCKMVTHKKKCSIAVRSTTIRITAIDLHRLAYLKCCRMHTKYVL